MSLPQYNTASRGSNRDPKIHPSPYVEGSMGHTMSIPSLSVINIVLIVVLFILVFWLATHHKYYTKEVVAHHLGELRLKGAVGPVGKGQTFTLELREDIGRFLRYPKTGTIPGLYFQNVSRYRLCCTIISIDKSQYYVCDYGQGATDNVGLECLLHSDNAQDTYAAIWIQDEGMIGSKCTLYWF